MKKTAITATPQQIEEAFAEWVRRFYAQPDQFVPLNEAFLPGAPEAAAALAAPYFIHLLADLQGKARLRSPTKAKTALQIAAYASLESEFITVPEVTLLDGTVVPSFRVGKYHCAKVEGKLVVSAALEPVVHINYYDSVVLCQASGYKLITDTQIMAIAHDIARQGINWTGGEVGKGELIKGLHKASVRGVQTGEYESNDPAERRWHQLSNGEVIFDFSGHLYSWVYDDVQGNEDGIIARKFAMDSISLQAPYPSMTNGVGWYPDAGTNWSGRAILRGSSWHSRVKAGVCRLRNIWPRDGYGYVGIRCTYP
jgi:hypothetical protein